MARSGWRTAFVWLLTLNLATSALSGVLALLSWRFVETLGMSLFLEAGALLLVGGAMGISPSSLFTGLRKRLDMSVRNKDAQRRGRVLVALGAVLLVESVVISLV